MAAATVHPDDSPIVTPAGILERVITRTFTSHGVRDTEAIAQEFARSLKGGECLALSGDLGAGKTQFVRGLVDGLGGDPRTVSSPTFVLLNVYDTGRLKVFHLDAYRVSGAEDFEAIGFAELLEQLDGVVVVEWADRVKELLPDRKRWGILIETLSPQVRRIRMHRER
jgi:tRNA threonylcarbamoyladenosine biosynthesis protein TsaE